MTHFDVIVIGGGPGGYTAAAHAGKHDLKTLLIEKEHLGGTCLNAGCIPTKALLASAKQFAQAGHADAYGVIHDKPPRFDFSVAAARKQAIIAKLRDGVAYQMARQQVQIQHGTATLTDAQTVQIDGEQHTASNIILATGAAPIPSERFANALTTTAVLALETLPDRLSVIGMNPISLGLANIFALMGVPVTVHDEKPDFLPDMDPDIAAMLRDDLEKLITFRLGEPIHVPDGETVVVNIGRVPNVRGIGLENTDLNYDENGVWVDETMRTNLPSVYAVGDVTGRAMWAHVALREAEVAVNHITGIADRMRYHAVPTPVYTVPEVATVGMTEAEAQAQGYTVRTARLPLNANGRFLTDYVNQRGLCKVVTNSETGILLGVHMIGPGSVDTIFGAAAMIEDEFRVQDARQIVFPHPTLSEIFKDTLIEMN